MIKLRKNKRSNITAIIFVVIHNIIISLILAYLAIYFSRWWIILFAPFVLMESTTSNDDTDNVDGNKDDFIKC